jgi:hypothetical protein
MAKQTYPDRWESPMLAAAMAVTGTLFLFDKLHSLMHSDILSWRLVPYGASVVLVGIGICLLVAQAAAPVRVPATLPDLNTQSSHKQRPRTLDSDLQSSDLHASDFHKKETTHA